MAIIKKLLSLFGSKTEKKKANIILPPAPVRITTEEEAEENFSKFGLQQYFELFKPFFRSRIDIEPNPADEANMVLGASKLGGRPDLPLNTAWPAKADGTPLSFIAQVNLQEIAAHPAVSLLPQNGLLSFFYSADLDAWGFDPRDRDKFCVLHQNDISSLLRTDFPATLLNEGKYIANSIQFHPAISLPDLEHPIVMKNLLREHFDNYSALSAGPENQLMGYAGCIQNAMELECELVTNGLYCGDASGYNDPRAASLQEGAEDWLMLLQIGSEEQKTNMMWGDAGRLYFWIRKQDLAEKHFDKAWCVLQCY